jgi:hypothetical protein
MGEEKLKAAFRPHVGNPVTDVIDAHACEVAETWDSIAHMALIAGIRHTRSFTATPVESGMTLA